MAASRAESPPAAPRARALWALWGVPAGVLGGIGHLFTDPHEQLAEDATRGGSEYLGSLDPTPLHVGVVAGIAAVACLLVLAAGWARWAERRAPEALAARTVAPALTASAGAMILGYGFKGSLAIYLPGGLDGGDYSLDALEALFVFIDLGPYMAWWGVAVAAGAVAWLGIVDRLLPIWLGLWGALGLVVPSVFLALTALPGFAGVTGPLWLIVISVAMALSRVESPRA